VPAEAGEVAVALGAPVPPTPDGIDRPGPGWTWVVKAGDAPRRMPLFMTGHYVLRVEPRGGSSSGSVRAIVKVIAKK
jgi:hypothetical protein